MNEETDMNFATELTATVKNALANPENYYDGGIVNWNYIDADTYMDMHLKFPEMENFDEVYYSLFDDVCDAVEAA
jgi:uncharacterized protein YcnI